MYISLQLCKNPKDVMAAVELGRNKRGLESSTQSTEIENTILDDSDNKDQKVSFFLCTPSISPTL